MAQRDKTEKVTLSDRKLRNLKPTGRRYEIRDTEPGLRIRVTESGTKSFALLARYPSSPNPTRRVLGEYPTMSLEEARDKARHWRKLLKAGKDPTAEEKRVRQAELRKQQNTFASACEEYLLRRVKGKRQSRDTERTLRRELIDKWGDRPLHEINKADVITLVEAIVDRGAPAQARNVLVHAKTFFKWAVARDKLEHSPAAFVSAREIIGEKKPRQRVLNDDELRAFWRATEQYGYPFGPLFRLLALTGCRKAEIGDLSWREIDLDKKLIRIPPERFKSDATHLVPLSSEAIVVLEALPRFRRGDYVFTLTGERPVGGFSNAKAKLDQLLAEHLGTAPEPFVIHDLRRTVRTRLSSLRVPETVAEMVIGHGRKGLARVYDQHEFESEMREALELWARRLRDIVTPAPENVIDLRARS
jgi:integrase